MALPKSTYVMGGVVLALFGLAVRDTLAKHGQPPPETSEEYADGMARGEAEAREAKLEAERQSFEGLLAASRLVFGAEVATTGMLFDGTALGRNRSALSASIIATLDGFETRTGSTVTFGPYQADAIGSITLQLFSSLDSTDRDRACLWLDRQIQAAWGTGARTDDGNAVYVNRALQQRAIISTSTDGCSLVFDRYFEPEVWIAEIMPLLGQNEDAVRIAVGASMEGSTLLWDMPGLGLGTTVTHMRSVSENRRITTVIASLLVPASTRTQLIDALVVAYGAPRRGGTNRPTTVLEWNHPDLHLRLEFDDEDPLVLTARKN